MVRFDRGALRVSEFAAGFVFFAAAVVTIEITSFYRKMQPAPQADAPGDSLATMCTEEQYNYVHYRPQPRFSPQKNDLR